MPRPRFAGAPRWTAWETGLRPFITKHQRTARLKQQMFVPSSRRAEALRSVLLALLRRIRGRRPVAEAGGPRTRALSGTSR
ncbi:hypothetical protein [Nocardia grenadensis]|uniref:hypothetical protein n=1 Tax=Nocardia grenadensis TaxID=931537 RepID=UPI0007A4515B|nr:hypothetical protein [Nocardia grenadensis]